MKDFFRIIAIKIGNQPKKYQKDKNGVELNFLKNIKPNTIYPIQNNFNFPHNDFSEILYNSEKDIDLYSLSNQKTTININAIVGSNGSGKSSLLDLLLWTNYNLGAKTGLLRDNDNKILKPFDFLDFEIFYSINNDTFISLELNGKSIRKRYYLLNNGIISPSGLPKEINNLYDLSDFFYSVVVNYSHYALNSFEVGNWINPLFHKNDGYQTPIVLNPMRTNGIIDINREKRLLTRRLIANILEDIGEQSEVDSLRNLGNNKIAFELKLTYNSIPELQEPKDPIIVKDLIKAIYKHFKVEISQQDIDTDMFINITINYIIEKLKKIATNYIPFRKYKKEKSLKYINAFIERILHSNSHIIFKVKGSILYLKYYREIFGGSVSLSKSHILSVEEMSLLIREINRKEDFWVNTFMMSPPSIFNVEIIPKDNSLFDALSSGEKQRIHSISSIVYHLINLNSVEQLKDDKDDTYLHYHYVNIVLDEIELYYHPEWQRRYIADLLNYLSKVNPRNLDKIKAINIMFLTHSPYILSDIPLSNTLRLENGKVMPVTNSEKQTFGANIHSLLANDFFMNEGFMGEWSKRKISETILFLNYTKLKNELQHIVSVDEQEEKIKNIEFKIREIIELINPLLYTKSLRQLKIEKILNEVKLDKVKYKKIIDNVGEPVLKTKLGDMYNELFSTVNEEDTIIQEIKRLGMQIGYSVELTKKEE
jgi:hypothetical protein